MKVSVRTAMARLALVVCIILAGSCARQEPSHPIASIVLQPTSSKLKSASGNHVLYTDQKCDSVQYATITFAEGLKLDIYFPPRPFATGLVPAVIINNGLNDTYTTANEGAAFKDLARNIDWARIIAARGLVAITYDSLEPPQARGSAPKAPASTLLLLSFLEKHATDLHIDPSRIAFYSAGATAAGLERVLASAPRNLTRPVKCVAFNYPFIDATVLPSMKIPILIVQPSGQRDTSHFAISDWATTLSNKGYPVQVVQNPSGLVGYDTLQDTQDTKACIEKIIGFITSHLSSG